MEVRKKSQETPASQGTVKTNPSNVNSFDSEVITRKEAFARAGKYAAFTAATMMMVLTPKESPAQSGESIPPSSDRHSPQNAPTWPPSS
jgi:hypothetical protein